MSTDSTDAAWSAARAAEPESMSRDELAGLLGDVRRARSCLDSIEMRVSRRMRELAAAGRAEPAESMIANAGGHSGRDAKTITERDELCEEMPAVEDAFADGAIAAGYVDAMAAAARGLPEAVRAEYTALADMLLARAGKLSLDAFRRECRKLAARLVAHARGGDDVDELAEMRDASSVKRWVDRTTGMHHTHLELDPIRDAKLHSTANAELARMRATKGTKDLPWQQLLVDAFVNAAAGIHTPAATADDDSVEGVDHPTGGSPDGDTADDVTGVAGSGQNGRERDGHTGRDARADGDGADTSAATGEESGKCGCRSGRVDRVPEITALISYEWLAGLTEDGVCETEAGHPIPISTMRRLCCDAEIIPTVLGGNGEVLDHGRSRRTASRAQRRALRAMHRGCAHPDCDVGFDACRIHHIRWWWRHTGPTDIDNLLPLCERHHHLVHEGGWTLTMTADRVATWRRPDGIVHHIGTTIDRTDPTPTEHRRRPSVAA